MNKKIYLSYKDKHDMELVEKCVSLPYQIQHEDDLMFTIPRETMMDLLNILADHGVSVSMD